MTTPFRRDVRLIALIGTAHFTSHFFHLALPPLFPLLKTVFGVPYVALGLLMSLFYGASGVGQTASGFLVDRFGARRVLLGGMALLAGSIGLAGLAPAYWLLLPLAVLAGLGNSVFHPADYSLMTAGIHATRVGRAYSVHSICGNLGWVAAPAVVIGLTAVVGWRAALVTVGALGCLMTLFMATQRPLRDGHRAPTEARGGLAANVRVLMSTAMLAAFTYFALLAMALIGIQTFSVPAMIALYEAPLRIAAGALTAFLLGNAAGILLGGVLADRTRRHDVVAASGMLAAAIVTVFVGSGGAVVALLPLVLATAGFCLGATSPSRDMLIRAATPPGASGKVFGFVYSGLDLGSALTPVVFGWLLDHGEPRAVFLISAVAMILTIATVIEVRRHGVLATTARSSA